MNSAWERDSRPYQISFLSSVLAHLEMRHTRVFGIGSLQGSLKMLDLALPLIYTLVFYLWKSVALDNSWDGDSRPFIFLSIACFHAFRDAPHSRILCRHLKLCLLDFLNMLHLALSQIYTRVFYLWKSVALKTAWVKDSHPFISLFHSRVFAHLAMRHTRVFCVGIPNYAYRAL